MPQIVHLGPLAMATDRLLAVALVLSFVILVDRIQQRAGAGGKPASGLALVVGVLVARAFYVAQHWDSYSQDVWSALAFWQGGFSALAGFLAAALVIAWRMRPRRAMLQGLGVVFALAALWFGISAVIAPAPRPLPELPALTRLDGTTFSPAELQGQLHVINLWATWCPPCRRELPVLSEVARQNLVPVHLVDQGETPATVAAYLEEQGVSGEAVLLDPQGEWGSRLESSGLPTTLFVNAKGEIVSTHIGELSRAALMDQIERISREYP